MRARVRAHVDGVVQGVGFRPYVYRLALEEGLAGWVRNDTRGVVLEAEGRPDAIERFLARLPGEAPPLASVERVVGEPIDVQGSEGFAIEHSDGTGRALALVSIDSATCEQCLSEVGDPGDRRYRYPFTNCTNCGPRFTIVQGVPYDRPATTMAGFRMCALCQAEYDDPADRRFHAQPNACPACGPQVRLEGADVGGYGDAIAAAGARLRDGAILAIKGLGGYHLACRADDGDAVGRLRGRKHREDKPFALMVAGIEAAEALVELAPAELELLCSAARPIVLAHRRADAQVAAAVAPGSRELGVMLVYTPLHRLLLDDVGAPLVMTSANLSDEPIAYRDQDALERLEPIADAFLLHDRPIHMRTDDSVVRVAGGAPRMLRRSRGFVPESIALPFETRAPLLACGAELKNTFCVAKGSRAWVSHHIGDLENAETIESFGDGIEHFERLFDVRPEIVAHDLHPGYRSSVYALEREGVETVAVQHHHAHLAACLAEHGCAPDHAAVGAIYDGTGYGPDATIWGGELLVGNLRGFERVGHLRAVALPGGDAAVREPWRMACAWLVALAADGAAPAVPPLLARGVEPARWEAVAKMALTGFASPVTTSMGRLFDAMAAICGIRSSVRYEGQAAIEFEAAIDPEETGLYEVAIGEDLVLDPGEAIESALGDLGAGRAVGVVSARFHNGVAAATARACALAAASRNVDTAVLSGGVFQNRTLLETVTDYLRSEGLRVLSPQRLPANDGGISYGQAAIAAACS